MDLGLTGKVAMVAGASRGLGYAVAEVLMSEGARISMASADRSRIGEAAQRLQTAMGTNGVLAMATDLRSADAIDAWYQATVCQMGGVDLLFVNTGGPPAGSALSFDDASWLDAVNLLLMSAVRLVRAVVPSMSERGGGSILFSTSSAVKEPIANLALSNVVRASVAALAKTLANELAPRNIRVNNLVPGRIDTDRVRELDAMRSRQAGISVDEQRVRTSGTIPLGRYGDPREFGRAAAFLLSDVSRYTTGASLQVDGGMIRGVL